MSDSATASVSPWAVRSRPTSASIGRSSPLNTRGPSTARTSASSASRSAAAAASVSARAVRRTLMPSIPLARKAMVAPPAASSAASRGSSSSATRRLALAPGAQHPADDHLAVPGPVGQVGQDGPLEHLLHLVGHARHRVDDLVPHRADEPGGGARALLDHGRAHRHVGLPEVVVRHDPAARLEQVSDDVRDRGVAHQVHAHHPGDGLAR